jgi:hypothetical protein
MVSRRRACSVNSFLIACLVALILLPAALLKWSHPSIENPLIFMILGGLEAFLALGLLLYHRSWRVWVLLALIVSAWMGFSLYTTIFGLPCSCMGGSFLLPRGMPLGLSGVMFLGALRVLYHYPTDTVSFKRLIWFYLFLFIIGFISSTIVYNINF